MTDFGEVLAGFTMPQLLPMVPDGKGGWEKAKPFGNRGLSIRVFHITYLWEICNTFLRQRFRYFGNMHLGLVFRVLQNSIEMVWMVEVLRVLDKAKFGSGKKERKNLTVRLCHERFQSSTIPDAQQKKEEADQYTRLIDVYDAADLENIRNRAMFHLDYEEHQNPPRLTGDLQFLTDSLEKWFKTIARVHYNWDIVPSLERHRRNGRLLGRHYRRMMMMYYRAHIGRPTKRKLSPENIESFGSLALMLG
jgi:hypothetical protein